VFAVRTWRSAMLCENTGLCGVSVYIWALCVLKASGVSSLFTAVVSPFMETEQALDMPACWLSNEFDMVSVESVVTWCWLFHLVTNCCPSYTPASLHHQSTRKLGYVDGSTLTLVQREILCWNLQMQCCVDAARKYPASCTDTALAWMEYWGIITWIKAHLRLPPEVLKPICHSTRRVMVIIDNKFGSSWRLTNTKNSTVTFSVH